ncbi:hypothetical protein NQ317_005486, partial [Molorchus minor]
FIPPRGDLSMLFNEPEIQYKYKNIVDNTQDEPGDSICCKQKKRFWILLRMILQQVLEKLHVRFHPTPRRLVYVIQRARDTVQIQEHRGQHAGRARRLHMLQTKEEVLDIVEDDPSTSTREIARQVNVSQDKDRTIQFLNVGVGMTRVSAFGKDFAEPRCFRMVS